MTRASVAPLACFIALMSAACAQTPPQDERRAFSETLARITAQSGDSKIVCVSEIRRCIVPVYVIESPPSKGGCLVFATVHSVEVKPAPSPAIAPTVVVWSLHHGSNPLLLVNYEFQNAGIERAPQGTGIPADNDARFQLQFRDPDFDLFPGETRKLRFRWTSRHVVSDDVHYVAHVRRQGATEDCEAADPVIRNTP